MTAVQAESIRGLGGWCGSLFVAAGAEFEPREGENESQEGAGVEQRDESRGASVS